MWLELLAVAGLILLNGFFACAELAIVNTRRSRVKQLAEEGNPNARLVAGFQEDSERFLATIQIGVTVAAAGGSRTQNPSTPAVRRWVGRSGQGQKLFISAEEIHLLMTEGREKCVFDKADQDLIRSVFEFPDTSVREVMVPRPKMFAIEVDTPIPDVLRIIDENKFSRYPVYRKELNDIRGILYQKDLLSRAVAGRPFKLTDLLHSVYYVPESMKVSVLLKEMQRRRIHMAIVVNEHGSVEGLVTLEDLIEEIVGEIQG